MPQRPAPRCAATVRLLVVVLAGGLLAGAVAATTEPVPAGAAPRPPAHLPPVDAAVHDPFRAPDGPYGAGNRGIEYDTLPGTEVRASADGRVTFAGWVAGTRHVTVLHDDGVRTTASHLDEVAVVVGQEVRQGDRLGTTVGRLHFGARRGDAYFDPAELFGAEPIHVRLVPFDLPPGIGPAGERSAVTQLLGLGAALGGGLVDAVGVAGDGALAASQWVFDRTAPALRTLWQYAPLLAPPWVRAGLLLAAGVDALAAAWSVARRDCTPDEEPVPPPDERRIGLLVAGFGSDSDHASIDDLDVDALGYEPADVLRFSYAGGRIPDADVVLPGVPVASYGPAQADQDLRRSGQGLADLVEVVVAAVPGVPVDLLAHSQGGVVARLALLELAERHGAAWLERVGLLATIGTPHEGADLATAGAALDTTAVGSLALEGLDRVGVHATDPSMAQLAETSDVIGALRSAGLPAGVEAVSIAARGDLVVPAPRTQLDGATEATVPIAGLYAHGRLPADRRTTREVALALAGEPPRCVAVVTALADEVVGRAIGTVEDGLGAALWGGAAHLDAQARPWTALATLAAEGGRR